MKTERHTLCLHDTEGNYIEVGGVSFGATLAELMHSYTKVYRRAIPREVVHAIVTSADIPSTGGEQVIHLNNHLGQVVRYTITP
jgi:hypothetical protein